MQRILVSIVSVMLLSVVGSASAYHPIGNKPVSNSSKSFAGVYPTYPTIEYGTGERANIVKRGEYLAKSADCIACHTNTGGKPFAGGLPIETPFGRFYGQNITPDKATGIGNFTEQQFVTAMRHGKAPDGSNYFPVFPYPYFNKMSEQDVRAIWAYLQTVPAVKQKNKENELPFPLSIRALQSVWRALFFNGNEGEYQYDPNQSKSWNRGAYLVEGPGHCGMCHTPHNALGGEKRKYKLSGAFIDNYWAPNITADGLKSASAKQLVAVFKQDELLNNAGEVAGPMREVNHNSLSVMTDSDLYAIATYLKSISTESELGVTPSYQKASLSRGKEVYESACTVCHQDGVGGAPMLTDSANWFDRAESKGTMALYRHTINGFNKMPIRGGCVTCSDEDIVSAVDYLMDSALTRDQKRKLSQPKQRPKANKAVGEEVYRTHCSVCHATGALGAPVMGDKDAWEPLIEKGMDELIESTLKGGDKMPVKGGCKYCTNSEVIASVKYMVQQSKKDGDFSLW